MAAFIAFISVLLALYGFSRSLLWRRLRLQSRVLDVNKIGSVSTPMSLPHRSDVVAGYDRTKITTLWRPLHWFYRSIVLRWERLGYRISAREWRAASVMALCLALLCILLFRSIWGVLLVLPILAGLHSTLLLVIRKRRMRSLDTQLAHMLTTMSGALRAGYSFLQALDLLVTETTGPLSQELGRLLHELTLGVSVEDALRHATLRVGSPDFDLITQALLIQRQVGGNLAEVLDTVCDTIKERLRLQGDLRSLTAQGRLSMWVFLLLTPGIGLLLYIMNPSYIASLWQSSIGTVLVILAIIGQVIGAIIIRRIVRPTG